MLKQQTRYGGLWSGLAFDEIHVIMGPKAYMLGSQIVLKKEEDFFITLGLKH